MDKEEQATPDATVTLPVEPLSYQDFTTYMTEAWLAAKRAADFEVLLAEGQDEIAVAKSNLEWQAAILSLPIEGPNERAKALNITIALENDKEFIRLRTALRAAEVTAKKYHAQGDQQRRIIRIYLATMAQITALTRGEDSGGEAI